MPFRSDLDALVLGALQSHSLHGYEISKRIAVQSDTAIRLKEGQLYPILHRLENEGRITSEWQESEAGKPPRRVYSLTDAGRADLERRRAEWRRFARSVDAILASPPRLEPQHG